MWMTTTSASRLSATPRATVAPTLPAPPTTVTFRFIPSPSKRVENSSTLHMIDDGVPELRGLQLFRAVHQPREIVRDRLGANRAVHPLHDEVRRLVPAHVAEHHLARQNHRARVDLVLIRVLRRGPVGRLEHRVAGDSVG